MDKNINSKEELQELAKQLGKKLDIENKRIQLKELEYAISDPSIWKENRALAEEKNKEFGLLRDIIEKFDAIDSVEKIRELEIKVALSGKYDTLNAVVSTYAGVGGEDAADWARISRRWTRRNETPSHASPASPISQAAPCPSIRLPLNSRSRSTKGAREME